VSVYLFKKKKVDAETEKSVVLPSNPGSPLPHKLQIARPYSFFFFPLNLSLCLISVFEGDYLEVV